MGNSPEDLTKGEVHAWLKIVFTGETFSALAHILTTSGEYDRPERASSSSLGQARPPGVVGLEQFLLSKQWAWID